MFELYNDRYLLIRNPATGLYLRESYSKQGKLSFEWTDELSVAWKFSSSHTYMRYILGMLDKRNDKDEPVPSYDDYLWFMNHENHGRVKY